MRSAETRFHAGGPANLPRALQPLAAEPRWVCWRWERHKERDTKVPYQPRFPGRHAKSNDPSTWADHGTAVAVVEARNADGIGFVLTDSHYAAFDLDDCRDPETGAIDAWAADLVARADSYAEVTISGTGIRIIGTAAGKHIHRKHGWPGTSGSVETYRRATRFIVVTGQAIHGPDVDLRNIDALIDDVVARLDGERGQESRGSGADQTLRYAMLPPELRRLIEHGVPEGQRSDQFHHAVRWLKSLGWDLVSIIAVLDRFPGGISRKFTGRIASEAGRSFHKPDQDRASETSDEATPTIIATPYQWRDAASLPRREWLYGHRLVRKFVSATVAPGGVGKSSLVLGEALSMVSGVDFLKQSPGLKPLRVWLWNLEDPRDEIERRVQAACIHHGLSAADVGDRLYIDSGREQRLVLARADRNGATIVAPVSDALVAECLARSIDVLIVDPFVSSHAVPENDNNAIDLVTKEWARIADRAGCAVELVHHTRKMIGTESEVTTESARGGKALTDACRMVRTVNRMTESEAATAGVESRRLFFRTYDDKANLAPPAEKSEWFQLLNVELGNGSLGSPGDRVGVVGRWTWPSIFDDVSVADLRRVQVLVGAGENRWRDHFQSPDWVGRAVAQVLKLDPEKDRRRILAILKVWMANGAFVRVAGKDSKGNERGYIKVGEWATDD